MKAKYHGKSDPLSLIDGKIYDVVSVESGWYRIIDETGQYDDEELPGYLYPPDAFEIVSDNTDSKIAEMVLSSDQLQFIQALFGLSPDEMPTIGDDEFSDLYDKLCDIEVEETEIAGDGELSERGKIVEEIVTTLGNKLYAQNDE